MESNVQQNVEYCKHGIRKIEEKFKLKNTFIVNFRKSCKEENYHKKNFQSHNIIEQFLRVNIMNI